MIVDANAFVGNWPFRQLDGSPAGLIELMDEKGVDKALVSAFEGVTYRNCHAANHELIEAIDDHRDRLIPVATINPIYANWEEDLEEAIEELGCQAVKLLPTYHYYDLNEEPVVKAVNRCAELDIPVIIAFALEDQRQRHPAVRLHGFEENHRDQLTDEQALQLGELLKSVPESDVIVADGWTNAFDVRKAVSKHKHRQHFYNDPHTGALYFIVGDLYMHYPSHGERIVSELGADHLCVGPMLPLKIFESYYGILEQLEMSETEKERVRSENVLELLD